MASGDFQQQLSHYWSTPSREGEGMTPRQAFVAYGLREAWRANHGDKTYGMLLFVKEHLAQTSQLKVSPQALFNLYKKFDADPEWFPGKLSGGKRGRKRALSGTAEASVARSLMARKATHDMEPTASVAIAWSPKAIINPNTGQPVDKKVIYRIMSTLCHDGDPTKPWVHGPIFSKLALNPGDVERRYNFCVHLANKRHRAQWYFDKVIFADICNSILPTNPTKAKTQALARKGKKSWKSPGAELKNLNLQGPKESLKLKG